MSVSSQFVVTSPIHGDVAGFANQALAKAEAHRLNTRLWDDLVYSPLVEVGFELSSEKERALLRQYDREAFEVVPLFETCRN